MTYKLYKYTWFLEKLKKSQMVPKCNTCAIHVVRLYAYIVELFNFDHKSSSENYM